MFGLASWKLLLVIAVAVTAIAVAVVSLETHQTMADRQSSRMMHDPNTVDTHDGDKL
jgi:mannose/fructose/N-acetylgalactosamine-specific phosphotransferase system component IIC